MISSLEKFYEALQIEIENNLKPIIYFESKRTEDTVKKIYRENSITPDITLEFWSNYKATMNIIEFRNFLDNISIPFVTYYNDIIKLKQKKFMNENDIKEKHND